MVTVFLPFKTIFHQKYVLEDNYVKAFKVYV